MWDICNWRRIEFQGHIYKNEWISGKITTSISFKILKAFVELFHDILDKTATIVKKDRWRQQHALKVIADMTYFTWNNSTIDNADNIRSIIALTRPLSFPFDIEMAKNPSLGLNADIYVARHLQLVSNEQRFPTEMLKVLMEGLKQFHYNGVCWGL